MREPDKSFLAYSITLVGTKKHAGKYEINGVQDWVWNGKEGKA